MPAASTLARLSGRLAVGPCRSAIWSFLRGEETTLKKGRLSMATTRRTDDGGDGKDELIVAALVSGATYPEAAEIARVSARTVRRRMADEEFARRVSTGRGEWVSAVTGRLTEVAFDAVDTLRRGLSADRPVDQIRAAHEILVLGLRYRTDHELEGRFRALEQRLVTQPEVGS